jgi:tetratricopeptide (TPR) repeat protein
MSLLFVQTQARPEPPDSAPDEERLVQSQRSIQSGDLSRARRTLQEILPHLPRDPRIYNFLGVIDAQEHQFAAAESNFLRAVQLAPRFTGAYLNLGRLYQDRGNEQGAVEKALGVYRKLLEFDPDHAEANYQAAWLLNRVGKFDSSLEHLARLPAEAQRSAALLALRCADDAALGRRAQAEAAVVQLAVADDLTEADVLPVIGTLHDHRAGDLATQLLEALVQRAVVTTAGLQTLARLQEEQGRFKEARESLDKDLQLEGPTSPVLIRLGKLAYQSRDLEGALGYLAHARDLEPRNAAIHFFFGIVCIELKLPPEARASLKEAVRLEPGNVYYNYALAAVLLQEKKAEEAIPLFRKFRDARPDDPRGNFALGVAYFDAYQLDVARKELQSAAAHVETRAGANLYLGRLALRDDNLAEAADRLGKAATANPSSPEAYAELALVHIRRKEFALAQANLDRALKIAPDHYRTNLNLLMLYQRTKDPRAEAQARHVEQLQKAGEEKDRLLLRSLEIRPY